MQSKQSIPVTLTIIYLALVAVCIAIYHLIIKFIEIPNNQSLAVNLLSWSATMFATIALLYTFYSWRNQRASEVVANEAKKIIEIMSDQLDTHRSLIWSKEYNSVYKSNLDRIRIDYNHINKNLILLENFLKTEYSTNNFSIFKDSKDKYLNRYISFQDSLNTIYLLKSNGMNLTDIPCDIAFESVCENYANAHLDMYGILIKISLHRGSLEDS